LRTTLYEAIGASLARQTLGKFFPGGSARQEIRRRVVLRTEKGEVESGATGAIIAELAKELIAHAHSDASKVMVKG
jgi:intracellular multiplication protein IcmB